MPKFNLALIFIILISCHSKDQYTHLRGQAQGTTFSIIYDSQKDYSTSVDSLLRTIDASMSLWDSTSTITKINENSYEGKVDIHFQTVFLKAKDISMQSNGYFDVTVGPLVKAWSGLKKDQSIPDQDQVDSLKKLVGYKKVELINGKIQKEIPNITLDFNALAQGYTVDIIADFLDAHSVKNYLVEIGGEVKAKGHNENNKVWQIGIDKPVESQEGKRPLQSIVLLKNRAMATSGSYRKYIIKDGKKYSHAIDPMTGYPITHNLLSISVFAPDCITADAYATAFLVMGLEKTKPLAESKSLEWLAIVALENGDFKEVRSSNFTN
jgi:thiamine biosynthesis lipoprotein